MLPGTTSKKWCRVVRDMVVCFRTVSQRCHICVIVEKMIKMLSYKQIDEYCFQKRPVLLSSFHFSELDINSEPTNNNFNYR